MTNRFLSTAIVSDLTKTSLVVASISANNLNPSQTLKTDINRRLVSADLAITDVTGLRSALDSTITTPYDGQLEAADFVTPTTTLNALSTLTNNIQTITQQIQ